MYYSIIIMPFCLHVQYSVGNQICILIIVMPSLCIIIGCIHTTSTIIQCHRKKKSLREILISARGLIMHDIVDINQVIYV